MSNTLRQVATFTVVDDKLTITGSKLRGVFKFRDEIGFPIDMSYELAREKGMEIDWIEALFDSARQCVFKYESLLHEIKMLVPDKFDDIDFTFKARLMNTKGETWGEKAENFHAEMVSQETVINEWITEQVINIIKEKSKK